MRTELHRHLEASLRPSTLVELSQRLGTEPCFKHEADVRARLWITEQQVSLDEVLTRFELFPQLLRSPAILTRVAREAVEDASAEGIDWIEFRYAPAFTGARSNLPWTEALNAFRQGFEEGCQRTGVRTGLICIAVREMGVAVADATIDFAIEHQDRVIAVDLAGSELRYPCRSFAGTFRRAHDAGLPITIHAGEVGGPENIWDAVDLLGERRIGHGLSAARDEALMRRLAQDEILIESCPTSNYITGGVAEWADHPLPIFLEHGIPVSIGTDDPSIFGVTLADEYERSRERIGLSTGDLARIDDCARRFSFLNQDRGVVSPPG